MSVDITSAPAAVADAGAARKGTRRLPPPWIVSVALLILLIGLWDTVSRLGLVSRVILPSPAAVLEAVPRVTTAQGFMGNLVRTLTEIVAGFGTGALVGFGLALLLGSFDALRAAYLPLLSALDAIPTVILAPMIVAAVGFGIEGKIIQAAIACFFAVFITTLSGLDMAERDALTYLRSLRAGRLVTLWRLRIPAAAPAIFGGLQIGAALAIIGAVVSEFTAADAGLGFLLTRYRAGFSSADMYVIIIIFLLIGLTMYGTLRLIENRVVYWRR
jgi:NitT/TauT family transport system permease protein